MVLIRNNVHVSGDGERTIIFAHGFGCDQHMWADVARTFESDYRTVLFDHVGAGESDLSAYNSDKYSSLDGYANDVVEIGKELGLNDAILIGHSVSSMICALATISAPDVFSELIMVGPSPRYINEREYTGGFSEEQIEELLIFLEDNHLGWSQAMGPAIMGNPDKPDLGERLTKSFCTTDPDIAREFARVTFFADNRADLKKIKARTLILQCQDDIIAPEFVGQFVHESIEGSEYILLNASGHCPNVSAPDEVAQAIRAFV